MNAGQRRALAALTWYGDVVARELGYWADVWANTLGNRVSAGDPYLWEEDFVALQLTQTDRPLTVTGFRRISDGNKVVFGAERVTIEPSTLPAGQRDFRVTVDLAGLPAGVYEGFVTTTTDDPPTPVADPVMPAW